MTPLSPASGRRWCIDIKREFRGRYGIDAARAVEPLKSNKNFEDDTFEPDETGGTPMRSLMGKQTRARLARERLLEIWLDRINRAARESRQEGLETLRLKVARLKALRLTAKG
jgi:hypothetical protein